MLLFLPGAPFLSVCITRCVPISYSIYCFPSSPFSPSLPFPSFSAVFRVVDEVNHLANIYDCLNLTRIREKSSPKEDPRCNRLSLSVRLSPTIFPSPLGSPWEQWQGRTGGTILICQGTFGDALDFCFYPRNDAGDVFEENSAALMCARVEGPIPRFHDASDTCFQFLREAKSNTRRIYITYSIIRTWKVASEVSGRSTCHVKKSRKESPSQEPSLWFCAFQFLL